MKVHYSHRVGYWCPSHKVSTVGMAECCLQIFSTNHCSYGMQLRKSIPWGNKFASSMIQLLFSYSYGYLQTKLCYYWYYSYWHLKKGYYDS